jgi:hypothetical protein
MPALRMGKYVGQGFVRRHLVQIAALTVAVGAVAVLAVVAFRPSGGSGGAGAAMSPVTSRPTATVDPRVDQVKAVARVFVKAYWDSARTGNVETVRALTEPDTQAEGNALVAATISKTEHHNFVASRVDFDDTSWQATALSDHATVRVAYRLYGHDAAWPSLAPRENDHESTVLTDNFQMQLVGTKWLVTKYN